MFRAAQMHCLTHITGDATRPREFCLSGKMEGSSGGNGGCDARYRANASAGSCRPAAYGMKGPAHDRPDFCTLDAHDACRLCL